MATSVSSIPSEYRPGPLVRREITASVEIDAPMDVVWRTLAELPRYEEWNSFTPRIEGVLEVGTFVHIWVHLPGRLPIWQVERVNHVDPGRSMSWGLRMVGPAVLCTNRIQELRRTAAGKTRYTTVDRFSGLFVPVVMALYGRPMQTGFTAMARDLQTAVVERMARR